MNIHMLTTAQRRVRLKRFLKKLMKGMPITYATGACKIYNGFGVYATNAGWLKQSSKKQKAPWMLLVPKEKFLKEAVEEWPIWANGPGKVQAIIKPVAPGSFVVKLAQTYELERKQHNENFIKSLQEALK